MDEKNVYDVAVEPGGLNWEQAGPLFDRYSVTLTGQLDRRWMDCYTRVSVNNPASSRFKMEPGAMRVTFTCRSTDGPVEVMAVLKKLEELLARVNKEVNAEVNARPGDTPPSGTRPTVSASPQPKRPTSIAADLLSRFTRH